MDKPINIEGAPTDTNDPTSDGPAAHPLGLGFGAMGGAAAGVSVGALAGPVGAAVGGVVGAVAGAVVGVGVAGLAIDPAEETKSWQEYSRSRPYSNGSDAPYDQYREAYRYGWECRARAPESHDFSAVEGDLVSGWPPAKSPSSMPWDEAKPVVRDGWNRANRRIGDRNSAG